MTPFDISKIDDDTEDQPDNTDFLSEEEIDEGVWDKWYLIIDCPVCKGACCEFCDNSGMLRIKP